MGRKQPKSISIQSASTRSDRFWTISKALIAIAIVLFVLTRSYILFLFRPQFSDIALYLDYAIKAVDKQLTPYTEDFVVPYPPLAFWTTCALRMFDDRQITRPNDPQQVMPIIFDYERGFRGMMFLCDLVSFIMLLLITWKRRPQMAGWAALFYTITTALLGQVLYDRLDVELLMLLMLGLYCWTRSLEESPWAISWATSAYAIVGLGMSFKIIPMICVPFLLLSDFYAPRRAARLTYAMIALAAGICVPFIIQYNATGPGVFTIFKFHAERGIQLESLYATLMMIVSAFGPRAFITHSHGAFDLSGDLSNVMIMLSKMMLLAFLAGTGIWALLRWSRFSRQDAYRLTCYVIPASVILSNVLSPQYFIWALPLLLLMAVEIFPTGRVSPWILGALLFVVVATTTWIYPYHYLSTGLNPHNLVTLPLMDHLDPAALTAYTVLGVRNFTYLGVVLWLGVKLFKRVDPVRGSAGA
jgi:hypothetical protein